MVIDAEKPNLVIFITTLKIGGAETVLFRNVESGVFDEYNLCVVSLKDAGFYGPKLEMHGVSVISLNLHKLDTFLFGLFKFFYLFCVVKPKVVYGWMYHANIFAFLFSKIRCKPARCIFSIRHSLDTLDSEKPTVRLAIWINAILSKYIDLILFNSHVAKEEHVKYGFFAKKIEVIPNGFDTDLFKKSQAFRDKYRSEFSIPENTLVVGHVGRYNYLKNHELLVSSFVELLDSNQNILLFLVGRGVPEFGEICKKYYPSSVMEKIYFLNELNNINEILSAFDIFCLPSRSEGFPNALAEAMSCSLPCISTDCGDTRIIIDDVKWIVAQNASDQFIAKLRDMIGLSQIDREKIGLKNRNKIEKCYEKGISNEMLEAMLYSIMSDEF